MTHSHRNDQKFIESIILYEVNNWTTIDEISENLHKLVGEEVFENDRKLDSSFRSELSVENITNFLKEVDVKDVNTIQNGQESIRSLILYETHTGKEKNNIYKKLCRNIGSDAIDYSMFSHWYGRFKNNYFNTDDNNLASKTPTFSDLPMDFIGILVEKLKLKEQLSLRKVSRNLRTIVDRQKPAYKNIEFNFNPNHVLIKFNGENVMYCDTEYDVDAHKSLRILRELNEIQIIKSSDYMDTAFNDMAIALKNPKLQLECLEFQYRTFNNYSTEYVARFHENMKNLLKTLNHKISVKLFLIKREQENHVLTILPYLKPGVLKTIFILENNINTSTDIRIDEIATLDQWKHAKSVSIDGWLSIPIEKFFHLNRFIVNFNSISIEDLILIRDKLLESSEFQYCKLITQLMPSSAEIDRVFGFRRSSIAQNTDSPRIESYQTPNSYKCFQLKITEWSLSIERIYPYEAYYSQFTDK